MYLSEEATWGRPKHPLAIADETTDDGEVSGRGLIAVKPILQGEAIFEVPYELILTKELALQSLPLDDDVDEYIAIACFLISERAKGEDSFWKPYLDILPVDEDLIPLFRWSEDDLALLKGSPCLSACTSLRLKLEQEFESARNQHFSKNPEHFPGDVFCKDAWEWAFAILFSRAIMLTAEQKIALVPYADLLNHNPFCSNYIDVQNKLLLDRKVVALYTDRPYGKMDQVFVTYGPKSNSDLLLLYGFVSDRNPYDSVEIVVSLSESDPLYDRKMEYMQLSGISESTPFPLYRDRYPMELIEFLRFCVADEEEFNNADFGDFINEVNETLVAQALIDACHAALKNYPQSRADDDKLIADRKMFQMLSLKQRWAVRQRRAEKRILERTINNIEQEMSEPTFMFTETNNT
ncbi:Rubisco LSMT substrate-binding protein [Gracilaria domingensis]|nr:Rubisco LSMT substrate-binding protein [Gracilaria domingensis]